MKCCKCQKEIDFGMYGMCPPCYKANNSPAEGDMVSQAMDMIATKLVNEPDALTKPQVCNWKQEDDWDNSATWNADCGLCWSMSEGSPKENGMNFCPGCGKPLNEVPFFREQDKDEGK